MIGDQKIAQWCNSSNFLRDLNSFPDEEIMKLFQSIFKRIWIYKIFEIKSDYGISYIEMLVIFTLLYNLPKAFTVSNNLL